MFCSKCGRKINQNDKFCPKCGQAIAGIESNAKDRDQKPEAPPPAKNSGCLTCFLILVIVLSIIFLVAALSYYSDHKDSDGVKIIIAASLIFVTFFTLGIWSLINQHRKSRLDKNSQHIPDISQNEKVAAKKGGSCGGSVATVVAIIIIIITVIVIFYIFNPKNYHIDNNETTTKKSDTGETQTSTSKSWDGYYPTTMSKPNCDSPIELTAFTVADDAVANLYGEDAKIGSDGKATMDMGGKMTVNFSFADSGVSGTWSSSRGCSGTFQGSKSW